MTGDGLKYLESLGGYETTGKVANPTIDTAAALMAELWHPERDYPVIHVTGTNGKGSTTAMIAGLLSGRGLRVGTYTSPHVNQLGERITVDGQPTSTERLPAALEAVRTAAERCGVAPSWFEAITAAALWELAEQRVDVAVIEVGMLGRWDATNVVDGQIAVVTNVELDHVELAGPTRLAIATEKAGIVKPGATLVLGETDPALRSVFLAERPGRVLIRGENFSARNAGPIDGGWSTDLDTPRGLRSSVKIGMTGAHQCDNAALALTAAEEFLDSKLSAEEVSAALSIIRLPGRTEIVSRQPVVIVDGAHNPAAAIALRRTIGDTAVVGTRKILVCGTLAGRDITEFLTALGVADFDLVVATEPESPRALPATTVADAAGDLGVPTITVGEPAAALVAAIEAAGPDGLVVGTGSLVLATDLLAAAAAA